MASWSLNSPLVCRYRAKQKATLPITGGVA
nr:MAG TPA: hypothetical protein [Bacteriophage sp.]DAN86327.1 MAG TPA: hypothetical protein [Bacteriophage sp.]